MPQPTSKLSAADREMFDRAAFGWKRWADLFAQRTDGPLYVELAGVSAGDRVLELGCGAGDQTMTLARAVRPGGRVVATDVSEAMVDVARERVAAAGLADDVELVVSDVRDLDLPARGFDAVVSGFMLMFLPEPQQAGQVARRCLAPGGRLVASVWGPPPAVPMIALPMMTALSVVGGPPPDPTGPGVFSLGDRDRLGSVLGDAGFEEVSVSSRTMTFRFGSAEQYADFMRDIAPPISDLVKERAPEKLDDVWAAVRAAAAERVSADGTLTFDNEALFVSGARPAAA